MNTINITVQTMLDAERMAPAQVRTYLGAAACFCYSTAHDIDTGTVNAVTGMLERLGVGHAIHTLGDGIFILQINK